jgi:hypothetical protein
MCKSYINVFVCSLWTEPINTLISEIKNEHCVVNSLLFGKQFVKISRGQVLRT